MQVSQGLIMFKFKGKYGFANLYNHVVIPAQYDDAQYFHNGSATVKRFGKYGAIDVNGRVVIQFEHEERFYFSKGLAYFSNKHNVFGYMNFYGVEVIKCQFDDAFGFNKGKAWVTKNGQDYYIDKVGRKVEDTRHISLISYLLG